MTLEELNVKITAQNEQFKQQIDEVNKKLSQTEKEGNKASKTLSKMFNLQVLTAGVRILRSAYNAFAQMSQGYFDKIEQETKLAEVMRERMNATNAQINAIKKLTEQEQALGVIDDDVLMAGLQQLGTFAKYPTTLSELNGAMANLIAQQKGYNATAQDAVTIGNLMGKVLQGQTSALTRVGITFTAAQEEVLKYGNEQERAAMLAEVITDNVGNMNAALLNTPRGQIKQLKMNLDDIGDSLTEGILSPLMYYMPTINAFVTKMQNAARYFSAIMQGLFGELNNNVVEDAVKDNEDLADSIEDVKEAYKEGTSSIDEFNVANGFDDKTTAEIVPDISFDDVEDEADETSEAIKTAVQPIVDFIKQNKEEILNIVKVIGLAVSPITRIATVIGMVVEAINENPELKERFAGMFEDIAAFAPQIGDFLSKIGSFLSDVIVVALNLIMDIWDALGPSIMALLEEIFDLLEEIMPFIIDILNMILPLIKPILELLKPIINALKMTIELLKGPLKISLEFITETLRPVVWLLEKVLDLINWINEAMNKAGNWFKDLLGSGKNFNYSFEYQPVQVPMFAEGQMGIDRGQIFVANENGPELIGTIGSKSAVANSSQIVDSISVGLERVLGRYFSGGGQTNKVIIGFDTAEAARILKPRLQRENNRTGGK